MADQSGVQLEGGAVDSTDENGCFRLTGVPPGTVKVIAREGRYSSEETSVKVYAEQESETELRLSNS